MHWKYRLRSVTGIRLKVSKRPQVDDGNGNVTVQYDVLVDIPYRKSEGAKDAR